MSDTRASAHHSRILMASLTLGALAMIAAVWWYYLRQRAAVEEGVVHELAAITAMKTAQIENWRAERIGDGGVLAASPIMRAARRILASGAATETDCADFAAVFQALEGQFLYSGAALVDLQGVVRIGSSVNERDSPGYKAAAQAAQSAGKATLSDIYRDSPPSGPSRMAVSVPVADLGAIVLNIDPSRFLYPFIASWPTAGRTGETLIFRREGNYLVALNDLRYSPGSALNLRKRILAGMPDDRELAAGVLLKVPDYRGVPTLSVIRSIRGSGWYLTAKVDQDEVYAPITRLSWELTLMVALIAIANSAGVAYIRRNEQLRAHRERKTLTGHFDSLTRYANDIIMLADDSGRIVEVNQRAVEAYGYTEEELKRLDMASFRADVPGQPPVWPATELKLGSRYQAVHKRKDGSAFPAEISARTIEVEGTMFCQAIVRDIGERVRTEEEIKALSARLINARDEERSRLARELHDDINQQIAALSIGMSNLKKQIPAGQTEARKQSERIQQNMAQVSESIRRLSHELHPAVLEYSGLGSALRDYCSEFGMLTNIQVSCNAHGCFTGVPPDVALCVFRVTQEALQNVAKHAWVDAAEVELARLEEEIRLTVSDRGMGMELGRAGATAGLGLVSIRERTRLVKGTFQIRSAPSQGTTLSLTIPVRAATGQEASAI